MAKAPTSVEIGGWFTKLYKQTIDIFIIMNLMNGDLNPILKENLLRTPYLIVIRHHNDRDLRILINSITIILIFD